MEDFEDTQEELGEIVPFEDHKFSTMTLDFRLKGEISPELFFILFPLEIVTQPIVNKKGKLCKLSTISGVPSGGIISANYRGQKRGIIRKGKDFRHSIELYISDEIKCHYCKLSRKSMQMAGLKSIKHGEDVAKLLIQQYLDIYSHLQILINDPELYKVAEDSVIKKRKILSEERAYLRIPSTLPEFKINTVKYFINLMRDFREDEEFNEEQKIDAFLFKLNLMLNFSLDILGTPEVEVIFNQSNMTNLGYDLGFLVDRTNLNTVVQYYPNFFSHYDNSSNKGLRIESLYTVESVGNNDSPEKKKKKTSIADNQEKVTFTVYRTGTVTQSGHSIEIAKIAYYDFLEFIKEIHTYIRLLVKK